MAFTVANDLRADGADAAATGAAFFYTTRPSFHMADPHVSRLEGEFPPLCLFLFFPLRRGSAGHIGGCAAWLCSSQRVGVVRIWRRIMSFQAIGSLRLNVGLLLTCITEPPSPPPS